MKLKLLLTPLIIVCALYLIIWVVMPEYTGPAGVNVAKKDLALANEKLTSINAKGENLANLANALNYNKDQQAVLRQYLPDKKQDEEVINSLSSIASSGGLLVTDIALKNVEKVLDVVPVEEIESAGAENVLTADKLVKEFNVNIEVSGDYGNIRKFIVAVAALKRFNNISALEIKKGAAADSNALTAKIVVVFNYLDKLTSVTNVDNKIFADGKFDTEVVNDIKKRTVDISKVDAGSLGRTNPFAL